MSSYGYSFAAAALVALRNVSIMAVLGILGVLCIMLATIMPALDDPASEGLGWVALVLGPLVVFNPLTLLHAVLYAAALTALIWRQPVRRTARWHIVSSGCVALASGLTMTVVSWGDWVWWTQVPLALMSTLVMTVLGIVVPAGLSGVKALWSRFSGRRRVRGCGSFTR